MEHFKGGGWVPKERGQSTKVTSALYMTFPELSCKRRKKQNFYKTKELSIS